MTRATAQLCMKSCNIKHNSESVFNYFASVKDLYAICSHLQALKKSDMFLCTPFAKRLGICTHFAQLISQTGFTLCRFTWLGFEIHLIFFKVFHPVSVKHRPRTEDCRLQTRGKMQTGCKMQTGGKMQKEPHEGKSCFFSPEPRDFITHINLVQRNGERDWCVNHLFYQLGWF